MNDREGKRRSEAAAHSHPGREHEHHAGHFRHTSGSITASAVILGMGALIAPELLPGMLIGAGAVLVSGQVSEIFGSVARPLLKSAIRTGYSAASALAEASEQFQDAVAEVRAEHTEEH